VIPYVQHVLQGTFLLVPSAYSLSPIALHTAISYAQYAPQDTVILYAQHAHQDISLLVPHAFLIQDAPLGQFNWAVHAGTLLLIALTTLVPHAHYAP